MKKKLVPLLTIFAALACATLAQAQIPRIEPIPAPLTPVHIDPLPRIESLVPPVYVQPLSLSVPPPTVYVAPVPVPAGGGGADGPPPSIDSGQAFVIAVCANASDVSDHCLEQSAAQAADKLSTMFPRQWAKSVVRSTLRVRFPEMTSQREQFRFLASVEKIAIAAVTAKMQADVNALRPYEWDTAATKAAKWESVRNDRTAVANWNQRATSTAESSSNWSHNWSSKTHTFNEGTAYRQLKQISISGWGGN